MRSRALLTILGAVAMTTVPAVAAAPPKVGVLSLSDLGPNLPYPYHSGVDANRAVAVAAAKALAGGKLLLIELGGNWCNDCRILAAVMDLPAMKPLMVSHYVVVSVDVGMMDKNLQIPARYGITKHLDAAPTVLIVDPKTGTLLNKGHIDAMVDARKLTPQGIADWLAQWVN